MAYQSLYRRYRPQTFSAIRGQEHVVAALQGAVRDQKVGHAYLLHGPRGTGKTTSARVLAKALNCENLQPDGEPCTTCESCVAIEQGRSFDLHELDAASNNKVEDMRDLLGKVNLGTPGRAKVYLLDEAHMLTPSAANALLKTLEEPPDHVTWVLATTEPHKLVATIRSRCQVFELGLLGSDIMEEHIRWIVDDAGLAVDDEAIDNVIATGGGSVRDTLSALDRVVAAGGLIAVDTMTDTLLTAIAGNDVAGALAAVGEATGRGRDPRTIGEATLAGLRDAFLTAMGSPPPRLAESDRLRAEQLASDMTPSSMTRALETLGTALVEMRQAPDPRVDLEVALVRVCRPESDRSLDALIERVERLEQSGPRDAATVASPQTPPTVPQPTAGPPSVPAGPPAAKPLETSSPAPPRGPAAEARKVLAERKNVTAAASMTAEPAPAPPPVQTPIPTNDGTAEIDLASIRPASAAEVVELAARHLGLDKAVVVERAQQLLPPRTDLSVPRDPAELLPLWKALVDEHGSGSAREAAGSPGQSGQSDQADAVRPPTQVDQPGDVHSPGDQDAPEEPAIDLADLVDAPSHAEDVITRLSEAFPGAELITTDDEERQ